MRMGLSGLMFGICTGTCLFAAASQAQLNEEVPGKPQGKLVKRTYTSAIDGAAIDYALWLPPGYEPGRNWPLIVFLHGSGEGKNWKSPTVPKASVPVMGKLSDLPFLVVFPLMRGSWSISGMAERDVLDTIDDVVANFAVDADRVHLTGLSLGAFAGWRIATAYPDRFASLALFSGGGLPELAVNLRHIPVQMFHGAQDKNVRVRNSRELVAAMREADISIEYMEYPQGKHAIWQQVYESRLLYQWMRNQTRVKSPRRISYRTHTLSHPGAYWARIEGVLDPSEPAYVDVFVPNGGNAVMVHVDNVAKLRLSPPKELLGGKTPLFRSPGKPFVTEQTELGWVLGFGDQESQLLSKKPGLSGPIQDVFCDSFVIVAASKGDQATIARWNQVVRASLAWTSQLVSQKITVIPAGQITPEIMERSNLICFGDVDNNPILAKLADRLPLRAEGGRIWLADKALSEAVAGFVMVYPNPLAPDRYVVVCSGLPNPVTRLAALALGPTSLHPPHNEDLLLMGADGSVLRLGEEERPIPARATMGRRLPSRGLLFDRSWRLTDAAKTWLRSIPSGRAQEKG